MAKCENCGKESEELKEWFVYDTDTKEVKIKKVCPECQKKYRRQAENSKLSSLFEEKMKDKREE